jgi:uncharacterized protein (DUF4415 family)
MRLVVADTSPVFYLLSIGHVGILPRLFGKIFVPDAMHEELCHPAAPALIKAKIARGEDRTNWAKVNATTGAMLEASIRADADDIQSEPDWTRSVMGIPAPKDHINIRIDHDVLEWFKKNGRGYQTLMNHVLRAFVQTRRQSQR